MTPSSRVFDLNQRRRRNDLNKAQTHGLVGADRASSDRPAATVRTALKSYIAALLLLTFVASCVVSVRKFVLHKPDTHSLAFCCTGAEFSDFTDLSQRVAHFGEPDMLSRTDIVGTTPYPYPVPSIYAFLFFVRLFQRPLDAYLLFALLSLYVATFCLSLRVKRISAGPLPQIAIWSTALLSYPLAFLLDRGNIEAVIWAFVLLGIVAYTRNRMFTSAILWAVAASMKIFPCLLFAMFLAKRRYRAFGFAIAATATITLLALAGVGPTIRQAASDSSRSTPWAMNNYILVRNLLQFDHSLFSAIKQAIHVYAEKFGGNEGGAIRHALHIYSIVVPLGAALLWWFRLRRMPLLNQFMAYLAMCILLPYVSNEYTLIYVYLIWGAFLLFLLEDVATARIRIPVTSIYMILISCACVVAPLFYIGHNGHLGYSGPIKAVILLILLWTVLRVPMPSSLFADIPLPGSDPKTEV